MDRVLFGDNQFFGINHASEEKARALELRFRDTESILRVLDAAQEAGLRQFMCTTHDRIGEVVDAVRAAPARFPGFEFLPCMPYAHKYANSVGEVGILETLRRFAPGGMVEALFRGARAVVAQDLERLMQLLVDAEMKRFAGVRTPVVFVQNVVTDLLLGLKLHPLLAAFDRHVRERYGAEAGFITMNLPRLVDALEEAGVENPIVCATVNSAGFRMSGGIEAYRAVLRAGRCRAIAMSVLASGALRPEEAVPWVCGLPGVEAIVFGASTAEHVRHTKALIDAAWGAAGDAAPPLRAAAPAQAP
jgi:hypothetical protein